VRSEPDGSAMATVTRSPRALEIRRSTNMKSMKLLSILGAIASLSALGNARTTTASSLCDVDACQQVPVATMALASPAAVAAAQTPVYLGRANNFTIVGKSGITTTGTTTVVGHIGVSPIASTAITGFGLVMDISNQWSTSTLVTGRVFAPDYSFRTQQCLISVVSDVETAYADAAGRTLPDFTELGAGDIGGLVLTPGLYKWGTAVSIPANGVTLAGTSTDVWIFQIAQGLTVSSGAMVSLSGGALAKNVFWQVAGQTTLGTTSAFKGIILCQTAIVMNTGATLNGRALAQTAVTLDANAVTPN
jgi:hypothetical protein